MTVHLPILGKGRNTGKDADRENGEKGDPKDDHML